jgi:hypothetical protein
LEYFKKEGDEYKKIPGGEVSDNCCKIYESEMYKQSMENQNVPKSCPIKAVSTIIHRLVFS